MLTISKKILTDEAMRPIAVQIDYQDWLDIERQLTSLSESLQSQQVKLLEVQAKVRRYIPAGRCLSDELVAERRQEAEHE